jgi:dTDP-4-amino-4,6-dideoxygalactose transaminase
MDWRLTLSEPDFGAEELEAVAAVLRSRWLTMGAVTQQFEEKFAEFCEAKHAIAVANGTAALHLACVALGLGPGDEVIVPALTFVATANAVLYCGATPVFADVCSLQNLTISPLSIREKITPATRAIVVMHYGGYPCDMNAIRAIAEAHNLFVIEDACHAIGAEYDGKKCGVLGDIGCFSFFSNKNLVTGEGGMLVTDDDERAQKTRRLRSHGMTAMTWDRHQGHAFSYDVPMLGFNYRIDEMRAALGLAQLQKLPENNRKRRELARGYCELLHEIPGLALPFQDNLGAPLPEVRDQSERVDFRFRRGDRIGSRHKTPRSRYTSACHLQPVVLPQRCDRTLFMLEMKKRGIQTSIHYPAIHQFEYYRRHVLRAPVSLPVTEEVCRREVTLPMHPLLTANDVVLVSDACRDALTLTSNDRVYEEIPVSAGMTDNS